MGNWRYDQEADKRDGITCSWCGLDICYCCWECGNTVEEHKQGCKAEHKIECVPKNPQPTRGRLDEEDREKLGAVETVTLDSTPDLFRTMIRLLAQNNELLTKIYEIQRANRDGTGR